LEAKSEVVLPVPGRHNAERAGVAGCGPCAWIPLDEAAATLRDLPLKRRLETVGTARGVTVIDDFAHNPDKIAATAA
jgi:UDP-N-acetylmuramate--alanine ligase